MDQLFQSDSASVTGFFVCFVVAALFSLVETAVTSLGSLKAKHLIDTKGEKVKELHLWLNEPGRVITTILFFNTAVNIIASAIATEYANRHFDNQAMAIAAGFTTFVMLIFSEIIPKTIGKIYSDTLAVPSMKFIYFVYLLTLPIIWILSFIADATIRLFGGGKKTSAPPITEEELEFLVNVGEKAGVFEETKQDMISGVFEFDEIKVREIMTPRTDMIAIESKAPLREAIKLAYESGHARIPVYDDRIDNVIGILLAKDLLQFAINPDRQAHTKILSLIRKPYQVPESKLIMDVFKELKKTKSHMAIVIDEYGGTAGLITLEDMLEEIVGEIQDEHDEEEAKVVEVSSGIYDVTGLMNFDEFLDYFDISPADVDSNEEQDAETVAGYMIQQIGDLPRVGQKVKISGLVCEISQVARHRIERVRVIRPLDSTLEKREDGSYSG
ncbi:MAG: hemolysin family protein [Proteobacteria bacterium]|nr:hemolysin family protein [Pseudomonadota bacterium]